MPQNTLLKILERGIEANTAATRPHGVGGWAKPHSNQWLPTDSHSIPRATDSLRSPSTPRSPSRCGQHRCQWPSKAPEIHRSLSTRVRSWTDRPSKRPIEAHRPTLHGHRAHQPHASTARTPSMPMVMLVIMVIAARGRGGDLGF